MVRLQSSSLSPCSSPCQPLQAIWQSLPKVIWGDNRRIWLPNQWPSSRGSAPAQLGRVWRASKHREFPSRRQSLRATKGSLEENVLPLLRYWLCSTVKKVLMLCRYWAATSHLFFSCEMKNSMELARSCRRPKQRPSLRSILLSFIGLWVKLWHRNKTACS